MPARELMAAAVAIKGLGTGGGGSWRGGCGGRPLGCMLQHAPHREGGQAAAGIAASCPLSPLAADHQPGLLTADCLGSHPSFVGCHRTQCITAIRSLARLPRLRIVSWCVAHVFEVAAQASLSQVHELVVALPPRSSCVVKDVVQLAAARQ